MTQALPVVAGVLCGTAFGAMAFFAGVFAPLIFTKLPAETAGGFVRQVFPWYYGVLAVLCGVGALAAAGSDVAFAVALGAVAAGFVYALLVLMPRINRLRDRELAGDASAAEPFQRAHRWSVLLNSAQLLVLLGLLVRVVA